MAIPIIKKHKCITISQIKKELFESNGGLMVGEITVRKVLRELSRKGVIHLKPKKGVCIHSSSPFLSFQFSDCFATGDSYG
jgi:Mn-dependent DtxR family transcriptional regulator